VLQNDRSFFGLSSLWLTQDLIGNRHLANIVHKRTASDDRDLLARQAQSLRKPDAEQRDATRVSAGFSLCEVERVAQRF
jgi:hypothetical protein